MAKPRIIIADTDFNYLVPLQYKFVKEFFEQIDLEIITDEKYFEEFVNVPQSADALIVSDELYDSSLQRHNISKIFVLKEILPEDQTTDLSVINILKYTNVKEILGIIVDKCNDIFKGESLERKDTQIVAVCSASGGVGKTTLAQGISACLSKNNKRVLYINAGSLQCFHKMIENRMPISVMDIYSHLLSNDINVYAQIKHLIRKEVFWYLPPFKAALLSVGVNETIYERIAMSAKQSKEFDYIVIDTDSSFDEKKTRLIDISNKVLVVTQQTEHAVYATNLLMENMNGSVEDKCLFVCNCFDKKEDNALIMQHDSMKFMVHEYIEKFTNYDRLTLQELVENYGVQRVMYLIM